MPISELKNGIKACYFRIKFKDIFNMKQLYEDLKEWLLEHGWSSVDMDGKIEEGKEHFETQYLDRTLPDGAVERWIFWRLQKMPVSNSYYKWHLDVDFHNVHLADTEVMREGKKINAHKGEVEIKVWSYVEYDFKGEWSKHPILKYFNKLFPNRIFKKDLDEHKKELYREAYTFNAYIKRWMKIYHFLPYEEVTLFHPSKAYPSWKKE